MAYFIGEPNVSTFFGALFLVNGVCIGLVHRNNPAGMVSPPKSTQSDEPVTQGCWEWWIQIMDGPLDRLQTGNRPRFALSGWTLYASLTLEWSIIYGTMIVFWDEGFVLMYDAFDMTYLEIAAVPFSFTFILTLSIVLKSKFKLTDRTVGNALIVLTIGASAAPVILPPAPGALAFAQGAAYAVLFAAMFYNLGVIKAMISLLPKDEYRGRMYEGTVAFAFVAQIGSVYLFQWIYDVDEGKLFQWQFFFYLIEAILFNINVRSLPKSFKKRGSELRGGSTQLPRPQTLYRDRCESCTGRT